MGHVVKLSCNWAIFKCSQIIIADTDSSQKLHILLYVGDCCESPVELLGRGRGVPRPLAHGTAYWCTDGLCGGCRTAPFVESAVL